MDAFLERLKDMKVEDGRRGGMIPAEIQREACRAMLAGASFSAWLLEDRLRALGAPDGACYRGADRLLQKMRKAGLIVANRRAPSLGWDRVSSAEASA